MSDKQRGDTGSEILYIQYTHNTHDHMLTQWFNLCKDVYYGYRSKVAQRLELIKTPCIQMYTVNNRCVINSIKMIQPHRNHG